MNVKWTGQRVVYYYYFHYKLLVDGMRHFEQLVEWCCSQEKWLTLGTYHVTIDLILSALDPSSLKLDFSLAEDGVDVGVAVVEVAAAAAVAAVVVQSDAVAGESVKRMLF